MDTIIHVFVKFCLVLNPTMCQELEIAPISHKTVSIVECMRGVMMGNYSEFTYQNARWRMAGGTCKEVPLPIAQTQDYLKAGVSR